MSINPKNLNAHDVLGQKNLSKKNLALNLPTKKSSKLKKSTSNSLLTKLNSVNNLNNEKGKMFGKMTVKVSNENDANAQNLMKLEITKKLDSLTFNNDAASKASIFMLQEEDFEEEVKNSEEENGFLVSRSNSTNLENLKVNVSFKEKYSFEKDEYREMYSKYVRDDYSKSIMDSLLQDEKVNENFLAHHKITERMRTRMVDWMIEVLSNYHCDESTFFESVNIMDRYFKICNDKKQILQPAELHLIGVTAMFISSKYQDIYPLRLKVVQDKIAHRKLSCQEIKDKEDEITRYLEYSIGLPTVWDFINAYLEEIFFVNCNKHQITSEVLLKNYYHEMETEEDKILGEKLNVLYTKNMLNLLKYVCIYLAKMNCHDYNLIQKKPSLLAASTIFVAIKICEQINKEDYVNEYFTSKLNYVSQKSENEIIKTAQKILYNAQNFDTLFSGLENLKKVHFNAIIELKNTK